MLHALALWPDDGPRRREQVLVYTGLNLDKLQRELAALWDGPEPSLPAIRQHGLLVAAMDAWFRELGGWGAVLRAPSLAMIDAAAAGQLRALTTAGLCLAVTARMDAHHREDLPDGPSLRKAWLIIEAWDAPFVFTSRSQIAEAWSSHRAVAAIGAAYFDMRLHGSPSPDTAAGWRELVARILGYQRAGLNIRPHGRKEPVLDPEWALFLDAIALEPLPHYAMLPLSPRDIQLVQPDRSGKKNA